MSVIRAELDRLRRLIASRRYRFANERELQDAIERVLGSVGVTREMRLGPRDRLDFAVDLAVGGAGQCEQWVDDSGKTVLAGIVAVEVKIDHSTSDLIRQLHRYAADERVVGILVVTSRLRLTQLPAELNGKPVATCLVGGAF